MPQPIMSIIYGNRLLKTLSHTFIIGSSYQTKHNSWPAFINLLATFSFAFVGGAGNILEQN